VIFGDTMVNNYVEIVMVLIVGGFLAFPVVRRELWHIWVSRFQQVTELRIEWAPFPRPIAMSSKGLPSGKLT